METGLECDACTPKVFGGTAECGPGEDDFLTLEAGGIHQNWEEKVCGGPCHHGVDVANPTPPPTPTPTAPPTPTPTAPGDAPSPAPAPAQDPADDGFSTTGQSLSTGTVTVDEEEEAAHATEMQDAVKEEAVNHLENLLKNNDDLSNDDPQAVEFVKIFGKDANGSFQLNVFLEDVAATLRMLLTNPGALLRVGRVLIVEIIFSVSGTPKQQLFDFLPQFSFKQGQAAAQTQAEESVSAARGAKNMVRDLLYGRSE